MDIFECKSCSKIYKSKHSLYVHNMQVHDQPKERSVLECEICNKMYLSKVAYNNHVKQHSKKFKCKVCGYELATDKQLLYHMKGHKSGRVFCITCTNFFEDKALLEAHQPSCLRRQTNNIQAAKKIAKGRDTGKAVVVEQVNTEVPETQASELLKKNILGSMYEEVSVPEQGSQMPPGPGIDLDIPFFLLDACRDLPVEGTMEMVGSSSTGSGSEDSVKIQAKRKEQSMCLTLEAFTLGDGFRQCLATRWHCSLSVGHIFQGDYQETLETKESSEILNETDYQDIPTMALSDIPKEVETLSLQVVNRNPGDGSEGENCQFTNTVFYVKPSADDADGASTLAGTADQGQVIYVADNTDNCVVKSMAQSQTGMPTAGKADSFAVPPKAADSSISEENVLILTPEKTLPTPLPEYATEIAVEKSIKEEFTDMSESSTTTSRSSHQDADVNAIKFDANSVLKRARVNSSDLDQLDLELSADSNCESEKKVGTSGAITRNLPKQSAILTRSRNKCVTATKAAPKNKLGSKKNNKRDSTGKQREFHSKSQASSEVCVTDEEADMKPTPSPKISSKRKPPKISQKQNLEGDNEVETEMPDVSGTKNKNTPSKLQKINEADIKTENVSEGRPTKAGISKKNKKRAPRTSTSSPKRKRQKPADEVDGSSDGGEEEEEMNFDVQHHHSNKTKLKDVCRLSRAKLCEEKPDLGATDTPADELYCVICHKRYGYDRRNYFSLHIRGVHGMLLTDYLEVLKASPEERSIRLQEHRDKELEYHRRYKARKYNKSEDNLVQCPACPTVTSGFLAFRTHITNVHIGDSNYPELVEQVEKLWVEKVSTKRPDIQTTCSYCSKEKKGMLALKMHMRLAHALEPDLANQIKIQQENYKGLYLKFRRDSYHKNQEVDKPTYKCLHCEDIFSFRSSRLRHMKYSCDMNPDRKKLVSCQYCDARFATRAELDEHRSRHVEADFKHICDICGLVRKTRAGMYEHKKTRHSNKPPKHKCPHCEKAFHNKERWERHLTVHSDERMYQCDMCGNSYKTKSAVYKHQKAVHLNEYKYRCNNCGHGMQKKQYLDVHVCGRVRRNQRKGEIVRQRKFKKDWPDLEWASDPPKLKTTAFSSEPKYEEQTVIEDTVAASYLVTSNSGNMVTIEIPGEEVAQSGTSATAAAGQHIIIQPDTSTSTSEIVIAPSYTYTTEYQQNNQGNDTVAILDYSQPQNPQRPILIQQLGQEGSGR